MKPEIIVKLLLIGEGFAPKDISKKLNIEPSTTWLKGDLKKDRKIEIKRKDNGWIFSLEPEKTFDLDKEIIKVLNCFESKKDELLSIQKEYGLKFRLQCEIFTEDQYPSIWLTNDLLILITKFGFDLNISIY
ncbi:MAG: DUF4279 domain-containing protein [Spirochaetales bacterium]|nr:DUF4279 domain-containing protein [Spirochaetales bacterium]